MPEQLLMKAGDRQEIITPPTRADAAHTMLEQKRLS
jgi:hypothetical protein